MKRPCVRRQSALGFSLVEVLVAAAIALTGLLVITQVFAAYEGWKRTTTGVAQSQEGGLLGAFTIEKDLRHAGLGMIGLRCAAIKALMTRSTLPPARKCVSNLAMVKSRPALLALISGYTSR